MNYNIQKDSQTVSKGIQTVKYYVESSESSDKSFRALIRASDVCGMRSITCKWAGDFPGADIDLSQREDGSWIVLYTMDNSWGELTRGNKTPGQWISEGILWTEGLASYLLANTDAVFSGTLGKEEERQGQ